MSFEALQQAVEQAGGQAKLARAVGISQPSVWHWVHKARRIPAEFVVAVEGATGISREILRPDLYAPAIAADPALAVCSTCDARPGSSQALACDVVGCPLKNREAKAA